MEPGRTGHDLEGSYYPVSAFNYPAFSTPSGKG